MEKKTIIMIIIGVLALIAIEVVVFLIVRKKKTPAIRDPGSYTRLEKLNNVLKANFGNSWPYVLAFFVILIFGILGMLYFVLKKETVSWNVSDHSALLLSRVGIILALIISLTLVGLGVYAVIKHNKNKDDQNEGDFNTRTKGQQLAEVIGLGLVLLVLLALIGWGVYHHFHHEKMLTRKAKN